MGLCFSKSHSHDIPISSSSIHHLIATRKQYPTEPITRTRLTSQLLRPNPARIRQQEEEEEALLARAPRLLRLDKFWASLASM
ncbi:hypothetical protein M0R45_012329 [Rubus argutus]|uniref:AC4 n=1 Tax=Rubus argutus TaxID=59490 RepID=A0AAW1YDA6_RUBAR